MIEPHRHCAVCGKTIPPDETFCSEKCKQYYEKKVKGQKRYFYLLMAFPLILVILLLVFSWLQ
jgi:predicted nucleic acid-binding Zn ribbon protein